MQPFSLLSSTIAKLLKDDTNYFDIIAEELGGEDVASSFVNSPEYTKHDLVQLGKTVIPVGLYSDGVQVGQDSHQDTLYVIYLYFPHLGSDQCAKPENKH
eukprot:7347648-Karenia_brevis.AAC.1